MNVNTANAKRVWSARRAADKAQSRLIGAVTSILHRASSHCLERKLLFLFVNSVAESQTSQITFAPHLDHQLQCHVPTDIPPSSPSLSAVYRLEIKPETPSPPLRLSHTYHRLELPLIWPRFNRSRSVVSIEARGPCSTKKPPQPLPGPLSLATMTQRLLCPRGWS